MMSEVIDEFEVNEQEGSELLFMLSKVIDVVPEVCDVFDVVQAELKEQEKGESSIMLSLIMNNEGNILRQIVAFALAFAFGAPLSAAGM